MSYQFFGWKNLPDEVTKVKATLTHQNGDHYIQTENLVIRTDNVMGSDPVLPYLLVRKIIGSDVPNGPQKIGDCVSWGWGNATNYVQCLQIAASLNKLELLNLRTDKGTWHRDAQDHPHFAQGVQLLYEYQEACTEWIYGSSRVEIGGQKGDREDGSVGAWAAKSTAQYGVATRKKYGPYDPQRAKDWGADGVPDDYEDEAKKHAYTDVVPCTTYQQAATFLKALRIVPVCSDQGFTETRDSKGGCRASGTWNHCMLFCAIDETGRLLCSQSWGPDQPSGPRYLDQPVNTFWVDPSTADRMLKQNDSFTPAGYMGYEIEDFISWHH